MVKLRRHTPGFTLMELLIVVIIVGILSTLALPQFPRAMEKARQAEARSMLGSLWQAERIYHSENGIYIAVPATAPGNAALITTVPIDASTEYHFKYVITSTAPQVFTATATRKTAAEVGKPPNWSAPYTVTITEAGNLVANGP